MEYTLAKKIVAAIFIIEICMFPFVNIYIGAGCVLIVGMSILFLEINRPNFRFKKGDRVTMELYSSSCYAGTVLKNIVVCGRNACVVKWDRTIPALHTNTATYLEDHLYLVDSNQGKAA